MSTLREMFDELSELDEDARRKRLEGIEDAEARSELESLLEADDEDHEMLSAAWMTDLLAPVATHVGERVGAFELTELLGSGGMGDVYLGVRADGEFEQEAAIKLVRRDLVSVQSLARFANERQILARLSHPNIARLFDGGVTDDGRPYLVMERVFGEPVDEHCRRFDLPLEARLDLFVRTCKAVQHAHNNLVVHCDLKPDNILVSDEGDLRLLDFGIATALGDSERVGGLAMTPEYAAPELFDGEPATTAADVYSLGVILYQLLTGSRPIELSGLDRDQRREKVQTTQTEPPSSRRRLDELMLPISSDLDAICLCALGKDPARRYASAKALADDVVRALEHRPVEAREPSIAYVARKFAKRHKLAVSLSALSMVAIAGLSLFYTTRLARERDRATESAARAEASSKALAGIFTAADPAAAKGEPITAKQLLAQGRLQLETELADQPESLSELSLVLGRVSFNLGEYANAQGLFERSLELERETRSRPGVVAEILGWLADSLREQSRFEPAEARAREALSIIERTQPDTLAVGTALLTLSAVQVDRGDFVGGLKTAQDGLAIQRRRGAKRVAIADTLFSIAGAKAARGDYADAEKSYREAYEESLAARGELHPQTANALADLAYSLRKQARFAEAEPLYRQALAIRERIYEGDHADTAYNLNHLGRLLFQTDRLTEAEPLLRRSLAMRRRLYGKSNAAVAASLGALSKLLIKLDRLDEAEPMARESLEILARLYGESHPYVAGSLGSLGAIVLAMGDRAGAIKLHRRSVAVARAVLEPSNPSLGLSLLGLGEALCGGSTNDEQKEGLALLEEANKVLAAKFESTHPNMDRVTKARADCK